MRMKVLSVISAIIGATFLALGAGSTPIESLKLIGNANGNGNSITNLATTTNSADAATVQYVNQFVPKNSGDANRLVALNSNSWMVVSNGHSYLYTVGPSTYFVASNITQSAFPTYPLSYVGGGVWYNAGDTYSHGAFNLSNVSGSWFLYSYYFAGGGGTYPFLPTTAHDPFAGDNILTASGSGGVLIPIPVVTNIIEMIDPTDARYLSAWQNPVAATNWTWTSDGTQITLTSYHGPTDVVIPNILDALPVTGFGNIFTDGGGGAITSISGGNFIASIAQLAFRNCYSLTSISLANVTYIGIDALQNCNALISISLPKVVSADIAAFASCPLLPTLSLPSATTISNGSEDYDSLLTSVTLPSIKTVGAFAMRNCPKLTSVFLGQNAPAESTGVYQGSPNATNYITNPTATGWGATWNGQPVVRLPLFGNNSILTGTTSLQTLNVSGDASIGGTIYVVNEVVTNKISVRSNLVVNGSASIGSNLIVGVGTNIPGMPLLVNNNTVPPSNMQNWTSSRDAYILGSDGESTRLIIDANGPTAAPLISFRVSGGTAAKPTAVTAGNNLFSMGVQSFGSTSYNNAASRFFEGAAVGTWTDTIKPYILKWFTTDTNGGGGIRMAITPDGTVKLGTADYSDQGGGLKAYSPVAGWGTNLPSVLVEAFGAASAGWSTNGTGLGVNSASGFAGDLLNLRSNGVSQFRVDTKGDLYSGPSPLTNDTTIKMLINAGISPPTDLTGMTDHPFIMQGADGLRARLLLDCYANGNSVAAPILTFRSANGTAAAPTASVAGYNLANLSYQGYGTTGRVANTKAFLLVDVDTTWTDASQPTRVSILTSTTNTPNSTVTRQGWFPDGGIEMGGVNAMSSISPGAGLVQIDSNLNVKGTLIQNLDQTVVSNGFLYSGGHLVSTSSVVVITNTPDAAGIVTGSGSTFGIGTNLPTPFQIGAVPTNDPTYLNVLTNFHSSPVTFMSDLSVNGGSNSYENSKAVSVGNLLISKQDNGTYIGRDNITRHRDLTNIGSVWTPRAFSAGWAGFAMSGDGKYQTACEGGAPYGYLWISSDYGNSWTSKATNIGWWNVAMSADGKYRYAVDVQTERVWKSKDYGNTWTAVGISVGQYQAGADVATSSDGKYVTAAGAAGITAFSSDFGINWNFVTSPMNAIKVRMSSDGRIQSAGEDVGNGSGQIWESYDYGKTWKATGVFGDFVSSSMSSDGKYQIFGRDGNYALLSTDYGNTWNSIIVSGAFEVFATAMSSDGLYQYLGNYPGSMWMSSDHGTTWVSIPGPCWSGLSISSDGKYLTGAGSGGYIMTCTADELITGNLNITETIFTRNIQISSNMTISGNSSLYGTLVVSNSATISGTMTSSNMIVGSSPLTNDPAIRLLVNANAVAPKDFAVSAGTAQYPFNFVGADNQLAQMTLDSYGSGYPKLMFRSAGGTAANPTTTTSFSLLANLAIQGYGATSRSNGGYYGRAFMNVQSYNGANWNDTNQGYMVTILTGPQSGVSQITRQRWFDDGGIEMGGGNPMGGTSPGSTVTRINGVLSSPGSINSTIISNGSYLVAQSGMLYSGGNLVLTNAFDDGSRFHSVWTADTNKLYIVSPNGLYTNLISTTHQ